MCYVCHRCRTCCDAPGVHARIESLVRSEVKEALQYLNLYGPVSPQDQADMYRRAVPHATEQVREEVRQEKEAHTLTAHDVCWLKSVLVRVDEDIPFVKGE